MKGKAVWDLDWSKDGQYLTTACADGMVRKWTRDGELLNKMKGHDGEARRVKLNHNAAWIVTSGIL